ncbi:selenium cofactor biosynthesis protein YqeC [Acetobacterium wieringae]|uniref:selenium cofactor biosynthesis protein YqeC n=1 Tax=Acetobacterium wieringae TaxID=52694 RepID=UPI0026F19CFD|nr:selenium cofactor biosynthesis protein YqeC [Acetobacterium wieringae]
MNLIDVFNLTPTDVITITGGGGKTSLMFALGRELTAAGQAHVITTTAKICVADVNPAQVLIDSNIDTIIAEIKKDPAKEWVIGRETVAQQKIAGFDDTNLCKLHQALSPLVIINEGDGSNRRPYKFYADYEPAIPTLTTKIIHVIGAETFRQPIDETLFHRSQLFDGEEPVFDEAVLKRTLETFSRTKLNPHFDQTIDRILLINKADGAQLENARQMAQIGKMIFPRCLISSLKEGWIKAC